MCWGKSLSVSLVAIAAVSIGGCRAAKVQRTSLTALDVAATAGFNETVNDMYGTNVVFDYNRDGVSDLMLSRHNLGKSALFRGNADLTFALVQEFPLTDRHYCDSGDFNGDSRPDLYCSVGAERGTSKTKSNELWLQNASGTFVSVPGAWGAADPSGRGRDVAVFDFNRDGRPDVFVGNGVPKKYASPNRLFINVAGRSFIDKKLLGSRPGTSGLCAAPGDVNKDGYPDLYVCGPYNTDRLFVSKAGVSYTNQLGSLGLPVAKSRDAQWADVNGDSRLDLLTVSDTSAQLWLNSGASFTRGFSAKLVAGRNAQFLDADQDGDQDFYVVQGHKLKSTINEPDILMFNDGAGTAFTPFPGLPQATGGAGNDVSLLPKYNGRPALIVSNGDGGEAVRGPRQLITFR